MRVMSPIWSGLAFVLVADLVALVAEALPHLHEELARVDELHLALALASPCGW